MIGKSVSVSVEAGNVSILKELLVRDVVGKVKTGLKVYHLK